MAVLWILGGLALLAAALALGPRLTARCRAEGDPHCGRVVFVGGLRWLGIRWGRRSVCTGLRKAGFTGEYLYWDWHKPVLGLFCLPVYRNRAKLEAEAGRLSDFLAARCQGSDKSPLYLIGCSAGAYVALRALERLPDGAWVDSAALLSAAMDPGRDLSAALRRLRGPLVNFSSRLDWIVLGLGTWLLGTADGQHVASAGMVGLLANADPKLVEIRWSPHMVRTGRFGGHTSATPPAFVARYVAPAMGIGSS